jgi:hypothetical protein
MILVFYGDVSKVIIATNDKEGLPSNKGMCLPAPKGYRLHLGNLPSFSSKFSTTCKQSKRKLYLINIVKK